MTIWREPVDGVGGPANRLAPLLRAVGVCVARRVRRRPSPTCDLRASEQSFEIHVDQALSIARQVPTLRVVTPAGQLGRTVRP